MFLTDKEFDALVDDALGEVLEALEANGFVRRKCAECGGQCCAKVGCGFFSTRFDLCPIHDYRPAKCRVFFCSEILAIDSFGPEVEKLLTKPVRTLSEVGGPELAAAVFGDASPSQGLTGLDLEKEAKGIVEAMEKGALDPKSCGERLLDLVHDYRRGDRY